ncbi:MAG: tetratricopeptide repeat protein [Ignavibacteriae bacterium]|nr:tetratricopeptide repeat protein [Ignavibacteriota bacterium]
MSTTRLEALQKFLQDDPADVFTHYALALEFASLNNYQEAITKLEALLSLDPNYLPAYHQLGLILTTLHRTEGARKIFEKGIQVAVASGNTHAQDEIQEALDELP